MRRWLAAWLTLALTLVGWPGEAAAQERVSRTVRVGLACEENLVRLTGRGPHELWDLATGRRLGTAETGALWTAEPAAGGILVKLWPVKVAAPPGQKDELGDPDTLGVFAGPLRLRVTGAPPADQASAALGGLPVPLPPGMGMERGRETPATFLWYKGIPYRGEMEVFPEGAGLTVVNVVPLEEYLYGVVGLEMSPSWPVEALKAQAVTARTYALGRLGGSAPGRGYDLLATPTHQVYGGIKGEAPASNAAVDATRGQVLLFHGQLAQTFYHASSGGHTENAENVWGSALPYLRGVPDFDLDSPWARWEKEVTLAEIGTALAGAGYDLGEVYRVEPAGSQGVSGRWTKLRVVGSRGQVEMSGNRFYLVVGLRSAKFTMEPREPGPGDYLRPFSPADQVVVLDKSGRLSKLDLDHAAVATSSGCEQLVSGTSGLPADPASPAAGWFYLVGRRLLPARIRFLGSGWGHGVGMSQYGARNLALRGHNYEQILQYYYGGTVLADTRPVTVQAVTAK